MRRTATFLLVVATGSVMFGALAGPASADVRRCPASHELADLPELEAFVEAAGGQTGGELTVFFEFVDSENQNGYICFKTLPEATPLPTPPLLAMDDRLPRP